MERDDGKLRKTKFNGKSTFIRNGQTMNNFYGKSFTFANF